MPPARKRLVLLCQHFYPEMISTGLHMTELATALVARDWHITVVCAQPQLDPTAREDIQAAPDELPGINIVRQRSVGSHSRGVLLRGLFAGLFTTRAMLWLIVNAREYDGVLVTTNPPFLGLAAALNRFLTRRPYVVLVYDVYPEIAEAMGVISKGGLASRTWRRVSNAIISHAARIVVIGRDMQDVVQRTLAAAHWQRIRFIPNWSDEANVHPVPKAENRFVDESGVRGKVVIQYAGRLGMTHNLEPLIDAAAMLSDLPLVVQIIGGGPKSARLQERATKAAAENVQFLGYQPHDRLDEVLSAADVAVVCLSEEFTGLSVPSKTYGILASGKPVLALLSRDSEIGRLLIETGCGVVIEHAGAAEVENAVRTLCADDGMRADMSARAREVFLRHYTLGIAAAAYDRCLSEAFAPGATATN